MIRSPDKSAENPESGDEKSIWAILLRFNGVLISGIQDHETGPYQPLDAEAGASGTPRWKPGAAGCLTRVRDHGRRRWWPGREQFITGSVRGIHGSRPG